MHSRLFNAFKADVISQFKQGFYLVYLILGILYLILLSKLNASLTRYVLPIVIYTDPSVLGFFFIGGISLLEKEQGILALLYVTPLKMTEYIISKVLSLTVISILAGVLISAFSYSGEVNYPLLLIGIIMTSVFYTLLGLIFVTKAKSVNSFFVRMIPPTILLIVPCFLLIADMNYIFLSLLPGIASLRLILGAYNDINTITLIFSAVWMLVLNIVLVFKAKSVFESQMIIGE